MPPVTMPPDPVRAAGLEPEIWHGLGIVGLWAAIDAFVERRQPERRRGPLAVRLRAELPKDRGLAELEDMRHLYAHNFGGLADEEYFASATRYVLVPSGYTLASGTRFDGTMLVLTLDDLRFYIAETRRILTTLDRAWR